MCSSALRGPIDWFLCCTIIYERTDVLSQHTIFFQFRPIYFNLNVVARFQKPKFIYDRNQVRTHLVAFQKIAHAFHTFRLPIISMQASIDHAHDQGTERHLQQLTGIGPNHIQRGCSAYLE